MPHIRNPVTRAGPWLEQRAGGRPMTSCSAELRQRRFEPLRGQWGAAQPHASRVEDSVGEGRGDWADRALASASRRQFRAVDEHDVDGLGRFGNVEDRIGEPVGAGHLGAVEGDLLRQGAAGALDDVALDAASEPVRVDDQPAIVGDGEFASPNLAGAAIDLRR
jgi:hypothetical protein